MIVPPFICSYYLDSAPENMSLHRNAYARPLGLVFNFETEGDRAGMQAVGIWRGKLPLSEPMTIHAASRTPMFDWLVSGEGSSLSGLYSRLMQMIPVLHASRISRQLH